jgi:hypothetical protein
MGEQFVLDRFLAFCSIIDIKDIEILPIDQLCSNAAQMTSEDGQLIQILIRHNS